MKTALKAEYILTNKYDVIRIDWLTIMFSTQIILAKMKNKVGL